MRDKRSRIQVTDVELLALRRKYPGSPGHPPPGCAGGLHSIALILGCSHSTIAKRLKKIKMQEGPVDDEWRPTVVTLPKLKWMEGKT
jgi:hypothetical protein